MIPINSKGSYFYWGFYSHKNHERAPLLVWLGGGPSNSILGPIFLGNGPYVLLEDRIISNKFSWNQEMNLLYIETPLGSGLSQKTNLSQDLSVSEETDNLLIFLKKFLMQRMEFQNREIYIGGQGHCSPFVASLGEKLIHNENDHAINFQGILLISAYLDPVLNIKQTIQNLKDKKLITDSKYDRTMPFVDMFKDIFLNSKKHNSSLTVINKLIKKFALIKHGNAKLNIMNLKSNANNFIYRKFDLFQKFINTQVIRNW